jgi:hypothetical protein
MFRLSHPFVERLIGTIRREYLDRVLFWTAVDLESKLSGLKDYYNRHRAHAALVGKTPKKILNGTRLSISKRTDGKNIVAGYFRRPQPHNYEFATDSRRPRVEPL